MKFLQKIAYASGDFGCNFIFASLVTWFIPFCVSKGLTVQQAGLIIFLSKFVDAAVDFGLAYYIDLRKLKLKPFLIIGAPIVIVSLFLLNISSTFSTLFLSFLFLNSFAYNIVNIPYGTLNLRLTEDQYERISLNCWRMFGSVSCMILVNFITPYIGQMNIINSFLFLIFVYFCAFFTKEKYVESKKLEFKNLKYLITNSMFWFSAAIFFIINSKLNITFYTFGLQPETAGLNTLLFIGPSVPMMLILPKVYKIIDKRLLLLISFIVSAALLLLFERDIVTVLIDGFAFSIMTSLIYNVFSDTSDNIFSKSGVKIEAILFAVAAVLSNMAAGISALFIHVAYDYLYILLSVGILVSIRLALFSFEQKPI